LCVSAILELLADKCLTAGGRGHHKVIVEGKGDWLYLLMAAWVLIYVEADAADLGKIEGLIYRKRGHDPGAKENLIRGDMR
jgi:hypothetical protein